MVFKLTKEFLMPVQALGMDIINQILNDQEKAGETEWLYRKVHYLKRINKRLGEQLLDTDKRNIHIKPWHWKEICGKAKKWDLLTNSDYLRVPIGNHQGKPVNAKQNQKLRELLEQWNKDLLSAPLSVEAENWKDYEISDRIEELLRESKK